MRFARGLGILLLIMAAGLGSLWWAWGRNLPSVTDLDVLEISGQTRVYDRTGHLIGALTPSLSSGGGVNRHLLALNEISPWLQKSVVTNEDRRFYEHGGVDLIGIARGLLKGILKNDLEGGSSITQQVVKNTLLVDLQGAKTAERKYKEAILAYKLDKAYDKNKILNTYLNVIYWGDGGHSDIIGVATAAQAYFKKNARDLNLAESAYLTIIIPAPNRRYKQFKEFRPLMKDLLKRMVEDDRITQAEADAAWKTPIYPAGWRISWGANGLVTSAKLERPSRLQENITAFEAKAGPQRLPYQYYLQAVEKELLPIVGRKTLYGGGKIFTGMSTQAQDAAEKTSLEAELPYQATLGTALLSPVNGEVMSLVGQKLTNDRSSDWNNATQARRQVGSSIKPLLYTLALQQGWKQSDTVLDAPLQNSEYQPQNYDGRWTGVFKTMRYSLDHSLNLPTVRIAQQVGIPQFESKLRDLGLTPPDNAGLSLGIGTLEASPLQMAAAYVPFVNGGLYYVPTLVRKVEDPRGKVIYTRPAPAPRRVWDEQTAWLGLDMLKGVVNDLNSSQGGLATRAKIAGWDVGGKTGTTNDIKDLWFVGVTPTVVGSVWVGKQQGGSLPTWAYSGEISTPIWQKTVSGALLGQTKADFAEPTGVVYRVVRQIKMAFRTTEADTEPIAHDGSNNSGFFGRKKQPQAVPVTQPAKPEPVQPEPVQPEPVQPTPAPANQPEQLQPVTDPASTNDPTTNDPAVDPATGDPITDPTNTDPTTTDSTNTDPTNTDPNALPETQPLPDQSSIDLTTDPATGNPITNPTTTDPTNTDPSVDLTVDPATGDPITDPTADPNNVQLAPINP